MRVSGSEYIGKSQHIRHQRYPAQMHRAVILSGISWRIKTFRSRGLDGRKRHPLHTLQCVKLLLSVFPGCLTLSSTIQKINMDLDFQAPLEKYESKITQPFCLAALQCDCMNAYLRKLMKKHHSIEYCVYSAILPGALSGVVEAEQRCVTCALNPVRAFVGV
ncbi:hypothetical protein C4J88_3552 [Pseudomonas sp. R4-39-08]|uniref:hypothetical protein n=1 Tax=Pseudomonas sp. R4-39-08 TaxID=1173288 RepID=UPI000F55F56B|nr:hypothetical protein [Pseudomonas sp. R4-39-08]AZF38325.1 hypothetical protein C4J88_3552 [Pseudomonas sp. R4-39-08]